jgi:hypothetical protein
MLMASLVLTILTKVGLSALMVHSMFAQGIILSNPRKFSQLRQ